MQSKCQNQLQREVALTANDETGVDNALPLEAIRAVFTRGQTRQIEQQLPTRDDKGGFVQPEQRGSAWPSTMLAMTDETPTIGPSTRYVMMRATEASRLLHGSDYATNRL